MAALARAAPSFSEDRIGWLVNEAEERRACADSNFLRGNRACVARIAGIGSRLLTGDFNSGESRFFATRSLHVVMWRVRFLKGLERRILGDYEWVN